jgi:hypothetical protein
VSDLIFLFAGAGGDIVHTGECFKEHIDFETKRTEFTA